MATPLGILGTTGVGGLTLGGGIGHLARKHGLTIDNLLGADVVLADGSKVKASADENADLFWAIRGGGGNFGVVTEFRYRLHPVSTVIAGPTFWSLDDTVAVMQRYREFLPQAPRELNGFFAFATVPPVAPFPEELHGRKVSAVVWCYAGDDNDAAQAAMAPMLEAAEPLMHGAGPLPFAGLQGFFDQFYPKGMQGYWRADFVNELSDAAIAAHHRARRADDARRLDDAHVPDRRRRPRRRRVRHRVEQPRRPVGRGHLRNRPRPVERRRDARSGRSTTSTPPTRTRRPAGPTSTS